ncbi:phosphocholine-specific phospholipase C [Pedobacter insulae]|uniref:phospholipase C n=1 Tax=Pedobacter insulae TaxID=414048 RepID=A0A1I2US11_9SPHI|nr:phospholipase C, phosphocholine-specific [Pedobacter insulae]SFG77541.1 phospholipase C [Pedobacter insulae]
MDSRRDFLKKTSLFAGMTTMANMVPESLLKAMSIDPTPGSTYKDAAHVVFLMQENRSFDHAFGALKGVRGFNDPRVLKQTDGTPVWLQKNRAGETYAPFRLDIKNSKITWMGSLPHSWADMVAARNNGKMDTWLEAKKAARAYEKMPLTMGYFDREDIPFYYAFADAFTICDQHFCSTLTGTSANRTSFWSGAVRENPHDDKSLPHVLNGQIDYKDISWKTYPERLEEAQIPWKVYQNELSLPVGFKGEEDDWLANFTDNSLEFFKQYNVRFHPAHVAFIQKQIAELPSEINHLQAKLPKTPEEEKKLLEKKQTLEKANEAIKTWNEEGFAALTSFEKSIHQKAFVTNVADPDYHKTANISYDDEGTERQMVVPKGDVLYQFRQDVATGNLPMVSWLVAPCRFSDHPGSPWHGAWYISEVLDILTKNEEVWKKTIFVLTYDESDGYFDHQSPFVPPHTERPHTGKASAGIHTATEFSGMDPKEPQQEGTDSPIGLGFRVPMVIASPWTKGGYVNSQIFDHTSCLQFLEHFILAKTGKVVKETNISHWRRQICGDLTSVFRPANELPHDLKPLERNKVIESIYAARFKPLPGNFNALTQQQLEEAKKEGSFKKLHPLQEPGTKPANALPYQHDVNLKQLSNGNVEMIFAAGKSLFGSKSAAGAFQVYAPGKFKLEKGGEPEVVQMNQWNFCVVPGDELTYNWPINNFLDEGYWLECYGANGFYRSFKGRKDAMGLNVKVSAEMLNSKIATGNLQVKLFVNKPVKVIITDNSYGSAVKSVVVNKDKYHQIVIETQQSGYWYDFSITIDGDHSFSQHYAGKVETGKPGTTDPLMGINASSI